MNKEQKKQKLALMKNRLKSLETNPKNIKCPGVCKSLRREIRNLETEIETN